MTLNFSLVTALSSCPLIQILKKFGHIGYLHVTSHSLLKILYSFAYSYCSTKTILANINGFIITGQISYFIELLTHLILLIEILSFCFSLLLLPSLWSLLLSIVYGPTFLNLSYILAFYKVSSLALFSLFSICSFRE